MSSPEQNAMLDLPVEADALLQRVELLREENEALGSELLRCYEQLNFVFEITEKIAKLQDPEMILRLLLQRFGKTIGAGALFLDQNGRCTAIPAGDRHTWSISLDPLGVQNCLAAEIEQARREGRALVPSDSPERQRILDGAHMLIVPLRQEPARSAVVIVLRGRDEPTFDSGDMLASESVLGYGGQVLANVLMVRRLQQTAIETVRALANAIDAKDNYTCGHSERVGWLARQTGLELNLPDAELELLEWAGILHDVGKIGIPEVILNKPGRLTREEFEEIRRHPHMSYEVLRPVGRLGPVLSAVLYHHENWDGTGYPHGLRGEQIPFSARVIRVVDTFDALTSTRAYRRGFPIRRALQILAEESGRGTDPQITPIFIKLVQRLEVERPSEFAGLFVHVLQSDEAENGNGAGQRTEVATDLPPVHPGGTP
jgi:HD-GYP domain-containing protein (c-di-GMP phosphodiesterase class II)